MRRRSFVILLVLAASLLTIGVAAAGVLNYRAHLSGRFEFPIMVNTDAQGQAIFQVNEDGTISYTLIVANINNVFMAHIHKNPPPGSPPGTNGPIVVWLYPSAPYSPSPDSPFYLKGRTDGILAEGVITQANLVNTGATGITTLEQLVQGMKDGGVYVNVHTNDFIPPANTGPGDFPAGEIHGPIQ